MEGLQTAADCCQSTHIARMYIPCVLNYVWQLLFRLYQAKDISLAHAES